MSFFKYFFKTFIMVRATIQCLYSSVSTFSCKNHRSCWQSTNR